MVGGRTERRPWTDEEKARVVTLWDRNYSAAAIAEELGRTAISVATLACRMGLARRAALASPGARAATAARTEAEAQPPADNPDPANPAPQALHRCLSEWSGIPPCLVRFKPRHRGEWICPVCRSRKQGRTAD